MTYRGFAPLHILVAFLIVVLIGGAGYYVWSKQNPTESDTKQQSINSFDACKAAGYPIMESYPEQCAANGKTFVNESQKVEEVTSENNEENSEYLNIKEWNVRIPLDKDTKELNYYLDKRETGEEYVYFSFEWLNNTPCSAEKDGPGVGIHRSKSKNIPPYTIDNTESFKKVGEYYYYVGFGNGGACMEPNTKLGMRLQNLEGGFKNIVANQLELLELIP